MCAFIALRFYLCTWYYYKQYLNTETKINNGVESFDYWYINSIILINEHLLRFLCQLQVYIDNAKKIRYHDIIDRSFMKTTERLSM